MNGIEKITAKIQQDAETEVKALEAQTQQKLDQAVHQRADDAHHRAVTVGNHHQRQHTAYRNASAQSPWAFEVEQTQYRADCNQNGTFHQLSQLSLVHRIPPLSFVKRNPLLRGKGSAGSMDVIPLIPTPALPGSGSRVPGTNPISADVRQHPSCTWHG